MDNHIKMGTPRPVTPEEVALGREAAKHLTAGAADCEAIRQDERRKAEQEITAWQHRHGHIMEWMREEVLRGAYHHDRFAPQQAVTPDSSPDLSEARGEVGGGGDWSVEQAPAKENGELRPCPFCGGPAEDGEKEGLGALGCRQCQHKTTRAAAIATWNTRPIEDRLRDDAENLREAVVEWAKRASGFQESCRTLEWDHAQAMALVLAHEGRIENQVRVIDQLLDEKKQLQQQLAEEKQYNDVLERRLREEEGKFCSAAEANGMHRKGGRQEAEAQILSCIRRWLLPLHGEALSAAWHLHDMVKAGTHRAEDPYPDKVFDRAQLRAETEHATAGKIADWFERRFKAEIVPQMIREGAWREKSAEAGGGLSEVAPDNDLDEEEIFTEELGQAATEDDPSDWRWARQMTLALVRWSISLSAASNGAVPRIRSLVGELLSMVELGIDQEENA